MSKWFKVVLAGALGVLFSAQAPAAEKGDKDKTEKEDKSSDKKKSAGWDVIQHGEDLKAIQADKLADLQKENAKENKDAQAKAKKENKKAPEAKKLVVLKKGLATKDEADKFIEKLKKEREKKNKEDKAADKADKGAHKGHDK
jgi:hypothetical protein